jgi:hypothetical protein
MANVLRKSKKRAAEPSEVVNTRAVDDLYDRRKNKVETRALNAALDLAQNLDVEKLILEIVSYQKDRTVSKLVTRDLSIQQVSEVAAHEQATRSRVVGLRVKLLRHLRALEACRKRVKVMAQAEESGWLANNSSNATDRTALIEAALLDEANERIAELEAANEIAEMIIKDLDSSGMTSAMLAKGFELEGRLKYAK